MAEKITSLVERSQIVLDALHHEEWTTSTEIGKLLGIGRQAVTKYMRALRKMGHPVESVPGKGHRLTAPNATGNLLLTEDELYALFLSLSRSTADFPETVIHRLQSRLLKLLSEKRQEEARQLKVNSETNGNGPFFQNLEILRVLQKSLQSDSVVRIRYQGIKDDEPRYRRILPIEFAPKKEWWYLICWDLEKDDERHFRIDRISDALALPEKGTLPEKFRRTSMHPWDFGEENLEAVLHVTPDLARWLDENPAHPSQKLTEVDNTRYRATYQVATAGKFVDWLMGLRGFQLQGPPPLIQLMKQRAEKIFRTQGTFNTPWEI